MADYTPIGQGTYNTVAGSIGLANAVFGNGFLGGVFGNNGYNGYGYGRNGYGYGCGCGVDREAFDVSMALARSESHNALLASELDSEKKMVEVYTAGERRTNELERRFEQNLAEQAVINCKLGNRIGILETKVDQLMGMTKLGIIPEALWPDAT